MNGAETQDSQERFAKRYRQLRASYQQKMGEVILRLGDLFDSFVSSPSCGKIQQEIVRELHNLVGTSAMFDFEAVSVCASGLEKAFQEALDSKSFDQVFVHYQNLRELIEQEKM